MKVSEYNQMMAYIRKPKPEFTLPEPKPQELLEIQEEDRKERLEDTMDKTRPFLMDESVDFIEREEFKFGGKPLTAEQKQAIIDAYNNFKKQKNFLPNLTDILESLPKAKHNNLYRIKQVLNEEKLKYSSAINPEKRKAADKIRVEAQKEKANPFKDNKALENKFIKDIEKRYEFPKLSSAAKEAGVLSNPELAKKYGVSERKIDRLVEKYAKDLSYPKQTLEGEAKKKAEQKIRRDKLIKEVSDKKIEGKIRDVKKGEKGIDLAHKASLRQFKDLGLEYYVDNLGFDKSKVNQELIIPTEQKLESLHKQRMNILKKVKPNEVPKSVQKELEKINLKMSKLSLESDGVLQAVLVDEKTLKPFVFNKNYANVVGEGLINKPVKDLTKADIDFIKATFPEAARRAPDDIKKAVPGGVKFGSTMIQPELANLKSPEARNLFKGVGRVALGELYFAPASIVLDTYAGLEPEEMILNVATFGLGTPLKDSVNKRKYIADLGYGKAYQTALTKRRNLRTAPESKIAELTEDEKKAIFLSNVFDTQLDLKREKKAEEYQSDFEGQLKRGELEVLDDSQVLEAPTRIEPEVPEEEEEGLSPFFDKILGTFRSNLASGSKPSNEEMIDLVLKYGKNKKTD